MRMRRSPDELESAFHEGMEEDRAHRDRLHRTAVKRTQQRKLDKVHKRGSMRFALLVLTLVATAVLVTLGMFQALFYVMG